MTRGQSVTWGIAFGTSLFMVGFHAVFREWQPSAVWVVVALWQWSWRGAALALVAQRKRTREALDGWAHANNQTDQAISLMRRYRAQAMFGNHRSQS